LARTFRVSNLIRRDTLVSKGIGQDCYGL